MSQLGKSENTFYSWVSWLDETWTKRWPSVSKVEMPELPWFNAEDGIQRLKKAGMLKVDFFPLRYIHLHREIFEDRHFINTLSNNFVRGNPSML